jgi:nitrogen fixation-related uncharacterized protein
MSWIAYTLIFGVMGLLSASVIYGLYWALKGGQMSNFAQGATSIFDSEEPQGEVTDWFPDRKDKE